MTGLPGHGLISLHGRSRRGLHFDVVDATGVAGRGNQETTAGLKVVEGHFGRGRDHREEMDPPATAVEQGFGILAAAPPVDGRIRTLAQEGQRRAAGPGCSQRRIVRSIMSLCSLGESRLISSASSVGYSAASPK